MHVAVFLIPVAGAFVLGTLTDWSKWAVEHGLLAAAAEDPLVSIPFADGAGLDLRRIIIATVVLVAVVVIAGTVVRPYRERAQLRAMREGDMS